MPNSNLISINFSEDPEFFQLCLLAADPLSEAFVHMTTHADTTEPFME